MAKLKLSRTYLRFFTTIKSYRYLFLESNKHTDYFNDTINNSITDCLLVLELLDLFQTHASLVYNKTDIDVFIASNKKLKILFDDECFNKCIENFGAKMKDNINTASLYNIFTSKIDVQKLKTFSDIENLQELVKAIITNDDLLVHINIEPTLFVFNSNILLQIISNIDTNIFRELFDGTFYYNKDKTFFNTIISGFIEFKDNICEMLKTHVPNWSVERINIIDRILITLAYVETVHLNTPRTVVINEYVNLAKMFNDDNSGKFVNGILDKILPK